MRRLALTVMTVWIVDSNAFIHLGSIASEEAIESLKGSLSEHGGAIHVTSGYMTRFGPSDSGLGGIGQEYWTC